MVLIRLRDINGCYLYLYGLEQHGMTVSLLFTIQFMHISNLCSHPFACIDVADFASVTFKTCHSLCVCVFYIVRVNARAA